VYKTFLSFRYLLARRTNWVGMAGIFVAVTALILILSIMSGFLAAGRAALRGSLADVIVQPVFGAPLEDGTLPEQNAAKILDIARADPRVAGACVELQWFGLMGGPRAEVYYDRTLPGQVAILQLVGIDLADEVGTTRLQEALDAPVAKLDVERVEDTEHPFEIPKSYVGPTGRYAAVVLGEQLAQAWHLHRGDEIEILTSPSLADREFGDEKGASNLRISNRVFVVAGTFRTKENDTDGQRIYLDRRELADFLHRHDDPGKDFTAVLIRLVDYERDHKAFVADIEEKLYGARLIHDPVTYREVYTWEYFHRTMLAAIENEKVLLGIMLSLVLVVAGFTVFAILSMMVTEKRRDIGILCALGGTQHGILVLFLMVGFWEALVGAVAGAGVGVLAAWKIDPIEQALSSHLGIQIFNRDVYIFDHIPSVIEPFGVGVIVLGAFVCTLVFAAIPAWRASRLQPVDALRYE
jgi:lipoprotein-releasing system permease protein